MDASARFVVVGGGVVAASAAYHLARRGASVIIVAGSQSGAATSAGAGIICPWTAPPEDACYRLCAEGAAYYPELLTMLAEDGEAGSGYAQVGTLCVAGQAQSLVPMAALLESRRTSTPAIGEVAALAPGEPARSMIRPSRLLPNENVEERLMLPRETLNQRIGHVRRMA